MEELAAHAVQPRRLIGASSEIKGLVVPALLAVLVGGLHFLGFVQVAGRNKALGLYVFAVPPVGQEHLYGGALLLTQLTFYLALCALPWLSCVRLWKLVRRFFPVVHDFLSSLLARPQMGWAALVVAEGVFGALNVRMGTLVRESAAIIIKPLKEVDAFWFNLVIDERQETITLYSFYFSAVLMIAILLAKHFWTSVAATRSARFRFLWGLVLSLQLGVLLTTYALLTGVAATNDSYPVVAFSGMQELLGPQTVPFLIAEDERQYGLLIVFTAKEALPLRSTVVFLPRTEVKWMTIVGLYPLHRLARYHDIVSMGDQIKNIRNDIEHLREAIKDRTSNSAK